MSNQFTGTYTPRLDDKGRLTLPAKFRTGLAGGVMVTKGQDHSLALYPTDEFAARAARAAAAARTSVSGRAYLRSLTAGADEQVPDGQGRITLSAEHRRYASLTKDCVVNGTWDFVEIWDAALWQAYSSAAEEAFAQAVEPDEPAARVAESRDLR